VVAVTRSIADLWILSGGALVGATDDAIEYFGFGSETTSIGTISKPNLEAIVALDPDLIMLSEELSIHEELAKQLETQNFEVMRVSVESFEDYTSIMQELTDATGRDDLYQQHVANVSAAVDDVRQQATASVAELAGKRSFLALLVSATKNKVLKDDYFACEIFRDMGLTNVATDNSPLDDLSLEAIVAADPAYIFVIPRGKEDEAQSSYEEAFASQPVWQSLPAVAEGRLWQLPKDLFQYKPNARWAEAYEHVLELIHG
jgi:iron complex transport system substrate-binding protein